MSLLTVAEARDRIASAAGLCASDARVLKFINRSIRRLLPKGKWVGTLVTYRVCVNNDCITWPRQIATIEAAAVCSTPITIRNSWYEFQENGPGLQDGNSCLKLVDRGRACAFEEITTGATDRQIRIYTDVNEGAGKYIILQGYDENAQWIRTQVSGTWIDGERVELPATAAAPVLTTKYFMSLSRVIKPTTNGAVRLYEYNATTAANVQALAYYEPDEKLPIYRRSFLPGLSERHQSADCPLATVTVVAKLAHYDVVNENDFLLIGNLDALAVMTEGLVHFDNKNWTDGYGQEAFAESILEKELRTYEGDGAAVTLRFQTDGTFGAGDVCGAVG